MNLLGPGAGIGRRLRTSFQNVVRLSGERGLHEAALVLERKIKEELSKPGSGRLYPRGKKRVHQASAPGEPPAVDFGRLRASVGQEEFRVLGAVLSIKVGTNVEYALPLEYGTGKIKPRPFMRPALEAARGEMNETITAELRHGSQLAW